LNPNRDSLVPLSRAQPHPVMNPRTAQTAQSFEPDNLLCTLNPDQPAFF
jgi:hypothetical protein